MHCDIAEFMFCYFRIHLLSWVEHKRSNQDLHTGYTYKLCQIALLLFTILLFLIPIRSGVTLIMVCASEPTLVTRKGCLNHQPFANNRTHTLLNLIAVEYALLLHPILVSNPFQFCCFCEQYQFEINLRIDSTPK